MAVQTVCQGPVQGELGLPGATAAPVAAATMADS